ncbi:transcription factor bHLH30-like [Rhododendron vialii]|uniref:transcription factor bHLH30-like n=1 Tax=Rhododendron vialii TaxID=182163 RepID=UPI00265F80D9|nr:transcription factor bHLH30-like [Rhododendron vialii]XP_058179614.1 transcription factor bHLH30-like [Rhododendron vialii]
MYSIPSYYELGSCSSSGNFLQGVVLSSSRTATTNKGNSSCSTAEKKAETASKNHSEAERRRRKRINTHLATLRTLLPKTIKTDKASLLAEVVRRLRELKKTTSEFAANDTNSETSQCNLFPTECDELNLCHSETEPGTIKATLCCEDRPELISEITAAVKAAEGKVVRAEMATVGGRTKSILWVQFVSPTGCGSGGGEGRLRRGLKGVVNRAAALSSTGPGLQALPENKRARLSQY